jgi:hypothetical protein
MQVPYCYSVDGDVSSVDTPFCSYRFIDGIFSEVLKRDVDSISRGGAVLGWREGQPLGVAVGEGLGAACVNGGEY